MLQLTVRIQPTISQTLSCFLICLFWGCAKMPRETRQDRNVTMDMSDMSQKPVNLQNKRQIPARYTMFFQPWIVRHSFTWSMVAPCFNLAYSLIFHTLPLQSPFFHEFLKQPSVTLGIQPGPACGFFRLRISEESSYGKSIKTIRAL